MSELFNRQSAEYDIERADRLVTGAVLTHLALRGETGDTAERRSALLEDFPGFAAAAELTALAEAAPYVTDGTRVDTALRTHRDVETRTGMEWLAAVHAQHRDPAEPDDTLARCVRAALREVVDAEKLADLVDELFEAERAHDGHVLDANYWPA